MEKDLMLWGDPFAGGGGTTTGAMMVPNVEVLWAINHCEKQHETK